MNNATGLRYLREGSGRPLPACRRVKPYKEKN